MYKFCKLVIWFWILLLLGGIYEQLKDLNKTLKETTKSVEVIVEPQEEVSVSPVDQKLDNLFNAVAIVESQNTPNAVGDGGRARGIIQMHKISVDEINQKCFGYNKYTWDDSWCPDKSKEMFIAYSKYIIDNRCHKYPNLSEEEVIARTWNGSYGFGSKPNTKLYWAKVQKELKNLS